LSSFFNFHDSQEFSFLLGNTHSYKTLDFDDRLLQITFLVIGDSSFDFGSQSVVVILPLDEQGCPMLLEQVQFNQKQFHALHKTFAASVDSLLTLNGHGSLSFELH